VPKALLGAAVLRDRARPEWPDESSTVNAVAAAAAAAAGAPVHEVMPPQAYRQLTHSCWAHEARDRWVDARGDGVADTNACYFRCLLLQIVS